MEINYQISKVIKAKTEDGATRFRFTERKVDRYGEVVEPMGAQLDNFKANPIILFGHGWASKQGNIPIGRALPDTFKQTKNYLDGDVIFDETGSDPFAEMIANKVQNGFLNAGSIGFGSIETSKEPVLKGQTGITHLKWELYEFSIVPIPALPSATARRGFTEFYQKCKEHDVNLEDYIPYQSVLDEMTAREIISAVADSGDDINLLSDIGIKSGDILTDEKYHELNELIDKINSAVKLLNSVRVHPSASKNIDTERSSEIFNEVIKTQLDYISAIVNKN